MIKCQKCKFSERDEYGRYQRSCLGYGSCIDSGYGDFQETNTIELERPTWEAKGFVIELRDIKYIKLQENRLYLIYDESNPYCKYKFGNETDLRAALRSNTKEHQFVFNTKDEAKKLLEKIKNKFTLFEFQALVIREFFF